MPPGGKTPLFLEPGSARRSAAENAMPASHPQQPDGHKPTLNREKKKGVADATPFLAARAVATILASRLKPFLAFFIRASGCSRLGLRPQDSLCQLNCVLRLAVSSIGWPLLLPVTRTVPRSVPLMTVPISPLPET